MVDSVLPRGFEANKYVSGKQRFGEGLALVDNQLIQITWQENTALVYDQETFEQTGSFEYDTEGWGICYDGESLYMSDGSSTLTWLDPTTFRTMKTLFVRDENGPVMYLNELEYIDGYIYANQWQAPYIFKIDPGSGNIIGKIDVTNIWNRVKAKDPQADVPNGIAYDTSSKKIFITGKKWPELYEIELGK